MSGLSPANGAASHTAGGESSAAVPQNSLTGRDVLVRHQRRCDSPYRSVQDGGRPSRQDVVTASNPTRSSRTRGDSRGQPGSNSRDLDPDDHLIPFPISSTRSRHVSPAQRQTSRRRQEKGGLEPGTHRGRANMSGDESDCLSDPGAHLSPTTRSRRDAARDGARQPEPLPILAIDFPDRRHEEQQSRPDVLARDDHCPMGHEYEDAVPWQPEHQPQEMSMGHGLEGMDWLDDFLVGTDFASVSQSTVIPHVLVSTPAVGSERGSSVRRCGFASTIRVIPLAIEL